MLREFDYEVKTIDKWHREAEKGDIAWFVRLITDYLLKYKISDGITHYVWASWVSMGSTEVMEAF